MPPAVKTRPSLVAALRLRCPYCHETALREKGSWVAFAHGCPRCGYQYEREEGYFTGAAWVVNYTFSAFWGVLVGGLLLWKQPQLGSMTISLITAVVVFVAAVGFFPFGKALWLWFDHLVHPLENGTPS